MSCLTIRELDDFEEWLDEKEVEDLALEDVDEGNEED